MSEEKTIEEALEWFRDNISSTLSGYRNDASKHLGDVFDRMEEVKTAAHRFDYSDIKDPDVYQNYATTIYEKTIAIFEEIEIPEIITYNNLENFKDTVNNKINSYMNMLAKYLSWLKRDRSYKAKVKNLDRSLSRMKEEMYSFENKTLISYTEIVKYEEVIDDLELLVEKVNRKKELEEEIASLSDEVERLTKIIDKKDSKLMEYKNHPGFKQLDENEKELDRIEILLSNKVSEIKKLCNKVLKAEDKNNIEVDDYFLEMMKNIIKDPLDTLVKESEGYPGIKEMLVYLKEISKSRYIQMKKEKMQRAYENIEEILEDEILEDQKRAKFLIKQSEAISDKFKEMKLDVKIQKLESEVENLKIDRDRITLTQRRELEETEEDITSLTESIEKRVEEYIDEPLKLVF